MRMLFLSLLVFSTLLFSGEKRSVEPKWKIVLENLEKTDKLALELFFKTFLKDFYGGYVLFGEKPLCTEGISIPDRDFQFSSRIFLERFHQREILLKRGYEVWENLPLNTSNFLIKLYEQPTHGSREIIFLNKKRVREEFEKHSSLFKYILGPNVTAEGIIDALEYTDNPPYSVLKDNRVLLGILLGYGTENALKGSRSECIIESLYFSKNIFPLKSGRELAQLKKSQQKIDVGYFVGKTSSPSFGFSNLSEEKKWLEKTHHLSIKKSSPKSKTAFPWFGYWESEESKKLLASYIEIQKKLDKLIHSDHFLEEIFEKLFDN